MHQRYLTKQIKSTKTQSGFSLIELMVVIVIVGIIARVAYPSYLSSVQTTRRSDALTSLSQNQVTMERCFAQNFSYSAACTAMPTFPATSPQGYYSIAISTQTATTYTLTATPVSTGPQAGDTACASMSVNQANVKTGTSTTCWNP